MASDYGYTVDQIFELTPRQFQLLCARAGVRRHNDLQRRIALAGGKPDYIDIEAEKAMMQAKANSDNMAMSMDKARQLSEERLAAKRKEQKKE